MNIVSFGSIPIGTDFYINNIRHRKTRPWHPNQYNASVIDGSASDSFVRIDNKTIILLKKIDLN